MDNWVNKIDALIKRINNFESNFNKCLKAKRTKGYLEGRITGLEELWAKVCEADAKIEELRTDANEKDSYFEDNTFGTLEDQYFLIKGEIKDQLRAFEPQPQQQGKNPNLNRNDQHGQSKVKLPKISLPTFEGSYHTWLSFKNRFTNLIHDNASLSNVAKLDYLKSCVTGEAERTIQRFQITDENYAAAWGRLNNKYDNKRILQDTQIETIIDRKVIQIETSTELRDLLEVVQESLEALKNMGVDTSSWDPFMVVLIKRKLAFKTREEWEKELNPTDVPNYAQLIAFLEKRLRTVEHLEFVGGTKSETADKTQTAYNKDKSIQATYQRANCVPCSNSSHSLMRCENFLNMTVSNRSAFVTAKTLCRNCLAVGHVIEECQSSKRCYKCNRNHHTLLPKEDFTQSQETIYTGNNNFNRNQPNYNYNPNPNAKYRPSASFNHKFNPNGKNQSQAYVTPHQPHESVQSQPNSNQLNPNVIPYTQPNQIPLQSKSLTTSVQNPGQSIINQGSENETLFPTAIVKIKKADGSIATLRALLDQCSEEVFIKESVAKMLGTKQESIPSFDVTGLECVVTTKVEKSTRLKMIIEDNEPLTLEANIVNNLIGMLPKSIQRWPKDLFKNIKLADPNFATPSNVDMMLGSKVYADILLGGVLKEKGYLAQNTKLGWIISGKSDETVQHNKQKICGFTRVMSQSKNVHNISFENPRKYYAPQRKSNPIYLSKRNQLIMKYSQQSEPVHGTKSKLVEQKSEINQEKRGVKQIIVKADIHQIPKQIQSLEISNSNSTSSNANYKQISNEESSILMPQNNINHKHILPPRFSLINQRLFLRN